MSWFFGRGQGAFDWGGRIRYGKQVSPSDRHQRWSATQRSRPLSGLEVLEPRLLLAFSAGPVLHGSQAAWIDYDNDGWTDVSTDYFLYQNKGDGTFTQFDGLGEGIWGDYDNDGYNDFFSWGDPHGGDLKLWHNNAVTGLTGFTDVTSLLPTYPENFISRGAAWGDFNGDAYLDLYIGGYEGSGYYADSLLINNAGESFTSTWIQGLDAVTSPGNPRPARGISTFDFDEDNDLDIYVSNYRLEPNALWQNDGQGNITDVATSVNAQGGIPGGIGGHTIGSAVGDIDNDGHFDIFVGNFSHNWFAQPGGQFLRNTGSDGGYNFQLMVDWTYPNENWQESYASPSLADYDNDGDLDLHFTAVYSPETHRLYRNDGNWNFTHVTGVENVAAQQPQSYQSAWADFDHDGDLDLLTGERLNINDASQQTSNNWLKIKLIGDGDNVNTSAIGAVVRVQTAGQTLTRQVESATGESNGNEHTLHFGLGNVSTPVTVEITWPDGTLTSSQQTPNEFVTISYGPDTPDPPDTFKAVGEGEIGEVGQITNLTHEVQRVTLNRIYDNPVVFAQSASNNGSAPVSVRVKNVHSDQFDIYLTEPSNENGIHTEETVNYIVLEAGVHRRSDGTQIEVGTVTTTATVGSQKPNQWQIVNFDSPFSSVPVVLSQIQTASAGGAEYLQTRYLRTDKGSLTLSMEQEEAVTTSHAAETIGYLALEAGSGSWNDMTYEAGITPAAVFSNPYDLNYTASYDTAPRILTNLASYHAFDNAHIRFENATNIDVQIKVAEDTTFDAELGHYSPETVAYLAIAGDGMLTALEEQRAIGEVGTLTDVTNARQTVVLERRYKNPVVFAQSPSYNGADPTAVRVDNVKSNQFDIFLAEPSDANGMHGNETVSYAVLETGFHHLIDGTRLEVGKLSTSATVGGLITNDQWETVSFGTLFPTAPAVFSQIQTFTAGENDYLHLRHRNRSTSGVDVALEQEEWITTQHGLPETVGYLAIEMGSSGNWGPTMSFEVGSTPSEVTDSFYDLAFNTLFATPPAFLSSLDSYIGHDNSVVRYENLSATGVRVRIQEDTTADPSTEHHSGEIVNYLAIEGAGTLMASAVQWDIGEVGRITNLTHEIQTITLSHQYTKPVVFAQSASYNGPAPVSVRVNNVQSNQFDIYLTEPSNENGTHTSETVSYIVLEAGVHYLSSGKRIEVATVTTAATAGNQLLNQWQTVDFDSPFSVTPVILSQIQTHSTGGEDYLQVRYYDKSAAHVVLALEQAEAVTTQHAVPEAIGFLAMEPGIGAWSGLSYETNNTPTSVKDVFSNLVYTQTFTGPPEFLTSLSTYVGVDNAHVRTNHATEKGVEIKVQEDTTFDTDLLHGSGESVAYLVIGKAGLLTARVPMIPPQVVAVLREGSEDTLESLTFTFNENVTVTSNALQLTTDSPVGATVNLAGAGFHYNENNFTATWDLSGVAAVTPARYTATLDASQVTDASFKNLDGNTDGSGGDDYTYHFLVATRGDVDLNGYVDLLDFNTLTYHYDPWGSNPGNDWSKANFDGDADVDITDFIEMLRNYSPFGYATQAVSVASSSSTVVLTAADSARQKIQASETLVANSAIVKVHDDSSATDRVFSNWDDQTDATLFLSDTTVRRRRGAPLPESDLS